MNFEVDWNILVHSLKGVDTWNQNPYFEIWKYFLGFNTNPPSSTKASVHRGDTALLVGSIVLLFTVFTVGIAILISRKQRRGNEENEYHSLMTK